MTCLLDRHLETAGVRSRPDFNRHVYGLMGIPVDALRFGEVEGLLRERIKSRSRVVWSTPNMNHLTASLEDDRFREMLTFSELSTVDGMPLVWMAKLLNIPILERVTGSGVFEHLMSKPDDLIRVYFFGGTAETGRKALDRLNGLSRSMRCVGFHAPGYGPVEGMSSDEVLKEINQARPDILVVALGCQRGHEWIRLNAHKLDVPIISHLGAVINFVGGTVSRAPKRMQDLGLEWLWRIIKEPYLAPRYARDFVCLSRVMISRMLPLLYLRLLSRIRGDVRDRPELEIETTAAETVLRMKGAWCSEDLQPVRDALSSAAAKEQDLLLDFSRLAHVTPEVLGLLFLARGHQARSGLSLRVVADNERIRKQFRLHCAEHLLSAL